MNRPTQMELFRQFSELPRRIVRARFRREVHAGHAQDLEQAGQLALWVAAGRFDPELGSAESLLSTSVWRGVMREAKRLRGPVRVDNLEGNWFRPRAGLAHLDATPGVAERMWSVAAEERPATWLLRRLDARATEVVRRVVLEDADLATVGAALGVSKQAVHQRVTRSLAHLRAAISQEAA